MIRMNKINLSKMGAWLGLGLILLCGLIPEMPADLIGEIVSWIWAISITILLCGLIDKIIIKLKKRKEEPKEEN